MTRDRDLASTSMVAHGIIVEMKRNCVQPSYGAYEQFWCCDPESEMGGVEEVQAMGA